MFTVGETVIAFVVCPVPHKYDVPPVAVRVIDVPAQGVLFDAEIFMPCNVQDYPTFPPLKP